uniref:Multiple ankyrin repeats single KH domain [Nasonia vitripennis] n=1 Tax=Lepeophtheirus salmonis TaxID=72036 RepID=A0A0K2TWX8_LEPSM
MIIEAAKGGYTSVVQLLIDYPNSIVMPNDDTATPIERVPPPDGISAPPPPTSASSLGPPAKSVSYKSVLRKNQRSSVTCNKPTIGNLASMMETSSINNNGCNNNSDNINGYDFLEGSNLVLEGLEDKGLDAKSYIHSMLRRTDGSTMEEKLIQKEHILAELQRVEKELQEKAQEKAQAQLMLSNHQQQIRESGEGSSDSYSEIIPTTELLQNMTNLSLDSTNLPAHNSQSTNFSNLVSSSISSHPGVPPLSQRALASLPPSERPKAKPSRKNDGKGGKKSQLQAAVLQHTQQLAQLQQLQQLNHQLQQQVHQQKQLKQQNQATLANLQQNAILNQQQLASLQANVAQLQQMEQQILTQQTQNQQQNQLQQRDHQLQQKIQHILHEKHQLQQQIKQFQMQVEQQLAYTQHATPCSTDSDNSITSNQSQVSSDELVNKNEEKQLLSGTYEFVQAPHAVRAVQTLPLISSEQHGLVTTKTTSTTLDSHLAPSIATDTQEFEADQLCGSFTSPNNENSSATLQISNLHQVQYPTISPSTLAPGTTNDHVVSTFGQQLIFQTSQILEGPLNFSSDLNFGSYHPGMSENEEIFNGTSMVNELLPSVVTPPRGAMSLISSTSVDEISSVSATPLGSTPSATTITTTVVTSNAPSTASTITSTKKSSKSTKKCETSIPSSTDCGPSPSDIGIPSRDIPATGIPLLQGTPMIDIDSATESNHDTALTLACAGGHEDLVKLLLSRGANIEHRDKKGFTPLILAATAGHEKVVEILLDHTVAAEIEAQSDRTKDTPLSLACSGGRYEVVEILLSRHANKEHRNVSDYTPLSLAASGGYVNIIKLLLSHGAEINSRTGSKLGISPLMLAAMNGHTAAVKLLLDMGSDINAQIETNRNTALTLACFQGRHEVVSLLLDRKAAVEHRAKTGLTPLMEAASGGYVDVGRVLLDKGADVNAPPVPSSRDTALTIAADKGHYRFVELLVFRGAQVDVRNKKGNSSLWLASNGGHLDVVQLLHSARANIDSQDNRKVSCLMASFRKGHSKVVKWMVKHVSQFPSDLELTRFITTINDRDLMRKCRQCWDIIRVAKDRQAAEAAKNATNLLEELDRESKLEQSKREAAARKREKKKRKKLEKAGKISLSQLVDDEDKENSGVESHDEDKEKRPLLPTNPEGKSGIEGNSHDSNSINKILLGSTQIDTKKNKKTKKKKDSDSPKKIINSPTMPAMPFSASSSCLSSAISLPIVADEQISSLNDEDILLVAKSKQQRNVNTRRNVISIRDNEASLKKEQLTSCGSLKKLSSPGTISTPNLKSVIASKEDSTGWKEVIRKSKKVSVPANAISRVIGRGGSNINAIRELSGAYIEVEKLASNKSCADRAILIKGSVDATRQANTWIQAIINCPEKDLSEIIGKQFKNLSTNVLHHNSTLTSVSRITSTSVTVSSISTSYKSCAKSATTMIKKENAFASVASSSGHPKKSTLSTSSQHLPLPLKHNSFAAVAQGSMSPTSCNKVYSTSSLNSQKGICSLESPNTFSNSGDSSPFSTTNSKITATVCSTTSSSTIPSIGILNDNDQCFSPFKPFCSWGSKVRMDKVSDENVMNTYIEPVKFDMSKAPGYRATVSTTTVVGNHLGKSCGMSSGWNNKCVVKTETAELLPSNLKPSRCNSAPGTPISSAVPTPIGPPSSNCIGKRSTSVLHHNTGVVNTSTTRSMTPELTSEIEMRKQRSSSLAVLDNKNDYLKIDAATGLPQENLLNAAAQLAAGFDFLNQSSSNSNHSINGDFGQQNRNLRLPVPAPPVLSFPSPAYPRFGNNSFASVTSKLNPNAPDFTRGIGVVGDYLRGPPPPIRGSSSYGSLSSNSSSRFGFSHSLSNILSNQSINSFLHSINQPISGGGGSSSVVSHTSCTDVNALDTASLLGGGRSLMEISDILSRRNDMMHSRSLISETPTTPKFSRPIGSERNKNKNNLPTATYPQWDSSSLYDNSNIKCSNVQSDVTSNNFPFGVGLKDAFERMNKDSVFDGSGIDPPGFVSGLQTPVLNLGPNNSQAKSNFTSDFVSSATTVSPGGGLSSSNSTNKKVVYLDRNDPNSIRRNTSQIWTKNWED